MKYDVIIIGAGASGLVAAITAARKGATVLVIEHKEKAGKKILATGNGKCNFTNLIQTPECYRSDDRIFAMKVLSYFDVAKTINFFKELGIYPKERNGYLYPNSEQAASVLSVLLMECERLGVNFIYNEHVDKILSPNYTIAIGKDRYRGRQLILATGGCASPKLGSDGSGYDLAKAFGHKIIKPLPALVQLKSSDKFCKSVSGVRIIAGLSLYENKKLLVKEEGEILFTDYGISGIPIMQVSRFAAKSLNQGKKVTILLDFMKEMAIEEVIDYLKIRISTNSHKTVEQMFVGLFNHKLSYTIIKVAGINPSNLAGKLKKQEIEALATVIKGFKVNIKDTNTFDNAQVTAGGVSTAQVYPATLESKLAKGLFIIGELLDVDGTCGGYNLQWAWSTGYLAGMAAGERERS